MDSSSNNLQDGYTIPLVGNKFQSHKPNKYDKEIFLCPEPENIVDPNAIAVYSKRTVDGKLTVIKLGYIDKYHNTEIKSKINSVSVRNIVRSKDKKEDGTYYYYVTIDGMN